jgi:hypothetical protein
LNLLARRRYFESNWWTRYGYQNGRKRMGSEDLVERRKRTVPKQTGA